MENVNKTGYGHKAIALLSTRVQKHNPKLKDSQSNNVKLVSTCEQNNDDGGIAIDTAVSNKPAPLNQHSGGD